MFDPLGMSRSTADPATASDLAQGYSRLFGFPIPVRQTVRQYEIGAGYIVSTAEDLARYAIAMMNDGGGLVTPEMAGRIFTPGLGDYGMGWYIDRSRTKIWHGGANEAFRTDLNLYPQAGRAFVLLVNEGHLADHYVASKQLTDTVEALVLGRTPPPVSQGWSVRWIGWALAALVLGLIVADTFTTSAGCGAGLNAPAAWRRPGRRWTWRSASSSRPSSCSSSSARCVPSSATASTWGRISS